MDLSNRTVLVTGAGGFIGLNVVKEYVHSGWHVYAMVHHNIPDELKKLDNVEIIQGDVTDENSVNSLKIEPDVVAHVAGLASDIGSDEAFCRINYEPIKFLSRLARKKFIYVSSSDVYGIRDLNNADENSELIEFPKNPYPKYKIKSEEWLKSNSKIPYVIIRPAAVYGENDKTLEKRFVDFLQCSPFIIHFGKWKGQNRWPLCNVKNVAMVIAAVSEFNDYDYQAVTIIDSKKTTIDEYYRELAEKYYPNKKYISITLPFWIGKFIGFISTSISNMLGYRYPIFDPTYYAVHHVSSNLDMSSEKMNEIINKYKYIHK